MTAPIAALQSIGGVEALLLGAQPLPPAPSVDQVSFGQMMMDGVTRVNDKLAQADTLTRAFALGEEVPLHQVTFALEQARLSVELMMQVRARLVEGYQEILRMPL